MSRDVVDTDVNSTTRNIQVSRRGVVSRSPGFVNGQRGDEVRRVMPQARTLVTRSGAGGLGTTAPRGS